MTGKQKAAVWAGTGAVVLLVLVVGLVASSESSSGGDPHEAATTAAPAYTLQSNPCVTSRMANGTWEQQGYSQQLAQPEAVYACGLGPSFDQNTFLGGLVGANTSGWNITPSDVGN